MQNLESQLIINRFWTAFDILKNINGHGWQQSVIDDLHVERSNFLRLYRERQREFPVYFFTYLCVNYKLSPDWLIAGSGPMFRI